MAAPSPPPPPWQPPSSRRRRRGRRPRPRPASRSSSPTTCCPGVNSRTCRLREAFVRGGWLMFIVLTLHRLARRARRRGDLGARARDPRTFHISEGAVVFIGDRVVGVLRPRRGADGLARRPRRGACRSSGSSSLFFGGFVFLSGLAVNAFMLFWTRFATGIAKASTIPVHNSLIADNYPIGIRARMSAAHRTWRAQAIGIMQPGARRRDRRAGPAAPKGWRWAGTRSASPCRSSRSARSS